MGPASGTTPLFHFELAPASAADLRVEEELLSQWAELVVLGDKAYISTPIAHALQERRAVRPLTVPRSNQKHKVSAACRNRHNAARAVIETVNGQLNQRFGLKNNQAHSFAGWR